MPLTDGNSGLEITEKRLDTFSLIVKRTMSMLLDQIDDGTLKTIRTGSELTEFNKNIDSIIVSRFMSRFNLN